MHRRSFLLAAIALAFLAVPGGLRAQTPSNLQRSNPQLLGALAEVVAKPSQYTVRIRCNDKDVALGAIVRADGWIVTKASELKSEPVCKLSDNREFPAKAIGVHRDYDLAILKIDATNLPVVEWKSSSEAEVGNWLVTPGIGKEPIAIGVVSVAKRKMPPQARVLPNPRGGYLGIRMEDAEEGVKVSDVMKDTPAAKAGLKVDDIVIRINTSEIRDREMMLETLGKFREGDQVTIGIRRDGKELDLKVTLGKRPADFDRGAFQNAMGSTLSERRTGFPYVLQHDTVLKVNDCGGPIVDLEGKVVGINIARAGRTESYAIPSESVQSLIPDLIAGKFPPAALPRALTAADRLKAAEAARTKALADRAAAEKQLKDAEEAIRKAKAELEAEKKKEEEKKAEKKPDPKEKKDK